MGRKAQTLLKERMKQLAVARRDKVIDKAELTIQDEIGITKSHIRNVEYDIKSGFNNVATQNKLLILRKNLRDLEDKLAKQNMEKKE